LKALRLDGKAEIANDLGAHSISQADVFEAKQWQPLCAGKTKDARRLTRP
jgi:hypothetical protein